MPSACVSVYDREHLHCPEMEWMNFSRACTAFQAEMQSAQHDVPPRRAFGVSQAESAIVGEEYARELGAIRTRIDDSVERLRARTTVRRARRNSETLR